MQCRRFRCRNSNSCHYGSTTFLSAFRFIDLWAIDLPHSRPWITLDEFSRTAGLGAHPFKDPPVTRAPVKLRLFLGRTPPIAQSLLPPLASAKDSLFRVVYRFENEQLREPINRTAHAAALSARSKQQMP